jgi:hypothetical protein
VVSREAQELFVTSKLPSADQTRSQFTQLPFRTHRSAVKIQNSSSWPSLELSVRLGRAGSLGVMTDLTPTNKKSRTSPRDYQRSIVSFSLCET